MHTEILDKKRLDSLKRLATIDEVKDFYLAGGTALSLQLGLRVSVDFDFMTQRKFNENAVYNAVGKCFANTRVIRLEPDTCDLLVDDIQISFMTYPYPLIGDTVHGDGDLKALTMASVDDLSAMKLSAIGGRGSRKDFYDLYEIYRLLPDFDGKRLLQNASNKFGLNTDLTYMLMGLSYFEEAERETLPKLFIKADWNDIKTFFVREQRRLFDLYEKRFLTADE